MIRAAVVGASGYVGGELLRLLAGHPGVEVVQATSARQAGRLVHQVHPALRGRSALRFSPPDELADCDVRFLALPHGAAAAGIERFTAGAERLIDCSADFRLRDPAVYARWYGVEHPAPAFLPSFVYGLPEAHRDALRGARRASGVGCNATAVNLALLPLVRAGWVDPAQPILAEVKAGSSESGREPSASSHHPERSGVVRAYAPVGHRHTAEVEQLHGLRSIHLSVSAVEMVRGVAAACHLFLERLPEEREIRAAYRAACAGEPFLRVVHERGGSYRHPEPRLLAGTNFADLGWATDPASGRFVALSALDNLGKGAAGSAVQCLNLMCGLDESAGLGFAGFHPS